MPDPSLMQSIRPEVQQYMHACEQLLAVASRPHGYALSLDEVQMVEAYMIELEKLVGQSPNQRTRFRRSE